MIAHLSAKFQAATANIVDLRVKYVRFLYHIFAFYRYSTYKTCENMILGWRPYRMSSAAKRGVVGVVTMTVVLRGTCSAAAPIQDWCHGHGDKHVAAQRLLP